MSEPKARVPRGVKLLALLLGLGGVAGVLSGVWGEIRTLQHAGLRPSLSMTLLAFCVLVFAWSSWTGLELWKGRRSALISAKILFAAQIPIFSVPGFSFDGFWTGLTALVVLSQLPPIYRFNFGLSSWIHFTISRQVDSWLFGINFVAVFALIYLVHLTSPAYGRKADNFGLI